jgi:hypothetical protein
MRVYFRKTLSVLLVLSLLCLGSLTRLFVQPAYAGLLSSASIQLSDSRPSQAATSYLATFTPSGVTSIKCVKILFATAADMTGGAPSGMVVSSSVKGTFVNLTAGSWTLNNGTAGTLLYTNGSGEATVASPTSIQTTTITNTSLSTFYAQVSTFTNTDCATGPVDQSNVIALVTVAGVTTTVTVSPTISFSIVDYGSAVNGSGDTGPKTTTSTTIPFGTVAAGATSWGSQTLTISTNGAHGYTLYTRYSAAMADAASDTIRDQSGTPSSGNSFDASTSQSSLAYTTDAGGSYNFGGTNKWAGFSASNVAINAKTAAINSDATHVEYKIGISNVQPPGTYSTVIAYTATPSY